VINFQGEIAALVAAMLWAVSSVLYGRVGTSIPPVHLNLIKGIVAIILLLITIIASGDLFPALAPQQAGLLLISGVMGIGLGDTAFLAAINSLGARRVLLLETLAPPITAIFAFVFLQESLNASAWCGVLLTILGVAWVIGEGGKGKGERVKEEQGVGRDRGVSKVGEEYIYPSSTSFPSPPSPPLPLPPSPSFYKGIGFALLAAVGNAAGAVLSRAALANSSINPLWAALLRLSGAVFLLLPWIAWQQKRTITTLVPYWKSRKIVGATCFAAFCGTFLGIWLQQIAIKFTAAGIASTLLQTSPVFVLPLAIWTGEKVSLRAVAGVAIAIAGIALLFYLK
jgi:drug/metabolite transporter (DMT)-like permease